MPRIKSYDIATIGAIGPQHGSRLQAEGVKTTGQLLRRGCSRQGRAVLAARTGLPEPLILSWVHRADLMRVPGVGKQFSELLCAAGVETVGELRRREARSLSSTLREINEQRRLAQRIPTQSMVVSWIDEALELPPAVLE